MLYHLGATTSDFMKKGADNQDTADGVCDRPLSGPHAYARLNGQVGAASLNRRLHELQRPSQPTETAARQGMLNLLLSARIGPFPPSMQALPFEHIGQAPLVSDFVPAEPLPVGGASLFTLNQPLVNPALLQARRQAQAAFQGRGLHHPLSTERSRFLNLGTINTAADIQRLQNSAPRFQTAQANLGAVCQKQSTMTQKNSNSAPGAHRNAESRVDVKKLIRDGATIFPCRARGMPNDHNTKTAFLVLPRGIKHGDGLLCSHTQCQNKGIRFVFCKVCDQPVAKHNFTTRHKHLDVLAPGETTKAGTKKSQFNLDKKRPVSETPNPALGGNTEEERYIAARPSKIAKTMDNPRPPK